MLKLSVGVSLFVKFKPVREASSVWKSIGALVEDLHAGKKQNAIATGKNLLTGNRCIDRIYLSPDFAAAKVVGISYKAG